MNNPTISSPAQLTHFLDPDRVGVAASILCAIHCGVAPILLLFLPAFGRIWAHPASHALVALLIVPLAVFSILRGYRRHRRRAVVLLAAAGVFSVLIGAALPAFGGEPPSEVIPAPTASHADEAAPEETVCEEVCCAADQVAEPLTTLGATTGATDTGSEVAVCQDNCCPSAQISETGEVSLHIPPAAIVTTLGGIFLIAAHSLNLCACRKCGLSCES